MSIKILHPDLDFILFIQTGDQLFCKAQTHKLADTCMHEIPYTMLTAAHIMMMLHEVTAQ